MAFAYQNTRTGRVHINLLNVTHIDEVESTNSYDDAKTFALDIFYTSGDKTRLFFASAADRHTWLVYTGVVDQLTPVNEK